MESGSRTAAGARRLRPLNQAQPLRLRTDPASGAPAAVELRGRWHAVARVEEVWRIDDGWWRPHPVQRTYFRLALDDGRLVTVHRDQGEGGWWLQRY